MLLFGVIDRFVLISIIIQRTPVVLGKPNANLLDLIIEKYHLNREKSLMIGDRLDTDIAFGKRGIEGRSDVELLGLITLLQEDLQHC